MSAPAHKNLKNPPGQIVNPISGTLREYIERKMDVANMSVEEFLQEKKKALTKKQGKLTYEQWYEDNQWEIEQSDDPCKKAWYAGQENK